MIYRNTKKVLTLKKNPKTDVFHSEFLKEIKRQLVFQLKVLHKIPRWLISNELMMLNNIGTFSRSLLERFYKINFIHHGLT